MTVVKFPGQPWTRNQLLRAYDMAQKGRSLREIAPCIGKTTAEVDLAFWRMLGAETVGQALEQINGQGRGEPNKLPALAP